MILLSFIGIMEINWVVSFRLNVDDFCWCGDQLFEDTMIEAIWSTFLVGVVYSDAFKYIGRHLKQKNNATI